MCPGGFFVFASGLFWQNLSRGEWKKKKYSRLFDIGNG
jgi:hypothetical protein